MIDDKLWSDLQALLTAMRGRLAVEKQKTEGVLLSKCIGLLEHETKRLEDLRAGRSSLLPHQVYLSVSSFNKGRLEIGGSWQEGTDLGARAFEVTQEAYRLYQQTRPAIT